MCAIDLARQGGNFVRAGKAGARGAKEVEADMVVDGT
jgi:hypothetical protein